MIQGRLVGGIICLVLAAVLGTLSFTLPSEKLMFMVGEENIPWLPAVILGVVGIVLVATTSSGRQEPET